MSLDELEKSDVGGEKAWESVKSVLGEVASLLKDIEGPFFVGKEGTSPQRVISSPSINKVPEGALLSESISFLAAAVSNLANHCRPKPLTPTLFS